MLLNLYSNEWVNKIKALFSELSKNAENMSRSTLDNFIPVKRTEIGSRNQDKSLKGQIKILGGKI